jgi:hypothetical protein
MTSQPNTARALPTIVTTSSLIAQDEGKRLPDELLAEHPSTAIGWISLCELSRVLGRSTARAARDWCVRHDVPYKRDGKHNFARLEDIKRALEALPSRAFSDKSAEDRAAAARAASSIMAGRTR